MPKYIKHENNDRDEGEGGSQNHHRSESNSRNKSGEHRSNRNGHNNTNGQSSGSYQNREDTESQTNLDLGPFTQAVNETVQNMLGTHKAIKSLADLYTKHAQDIEQIPKIQQRFGELEENCRYKDVIIKNQDCTIETLWKKACDREEQVNQEKEYLVEERRALEQEKIKVEKDKDVAAKRVEIQKVEQEHELNKEIQKRKNELEKQFRDREKDLEREMQEREDGHKQQVANLERDKSTLLKKLEEFEEENVKHKVALTEAKDKYDILERAKESYKTDIHKLGTRLKTIENEFVLNTETTEFYTKKFAEISRTIEEISMQYLKELKSEDTSTIHQKLVDADIGFAFIPISESKESRDLRIACVQHIISASLSNIIWQPFSSEKTLSHPDIVPILGDISTELAKSSDKSSSGRRAASVWRALTMRALQSLLPDFPPSEGDSPPLSRAENFVRKVLSISFLLVDPLQEPQLRIDLLALANSAISVWSSAQTGELELIVSSSLDCTRRNEWRSLMFDPLSSPSTESDTVDKIVSSTQSRIFTLFPHVTALKLSRSTEAPAGLPGSWPEADQEPHMIETCLHSGTGLPEWSALVVKGKEEEDLRLQYLEKERIQERLAELEKQKQELEAQGERNRKHSRNGSVAGPASGPTSPIAQWTREGTRKMYEDH